LKEQRNEEFAIAEAPERAVLRKGKPMKARLLKKWGTNYAGQVLTNVDKGSIPAGIAEFFEDDDPAVNTVVEQGDVSDPLMVINDEINPAHAKEHNEAQRGKAKSSRAFVDKNSAAAELQALEEQQTQERARHADLVAAGRTKAGKAGKGGKGQLSKGQRDKNAAGKGPRGKGK
jgi:hypothetical protein